jgi:hypothetical protein
VKVGVNTIWPVALSTVEVMAQLSSMFAVPTVAADAKMAYV